MPSDDLGRVRNDFGQTDLSALERRAHAQDDQSRFFGPLPFFDLPTGRLLLPSAASSAAPSFIGCRLGAGLSPALTNSGAAVGTPFDLYFPTGSFGTIPPSPDGGYDTSGFAPQGATDPRLLTVPADGLYLLEAYLNLEIIPPAATGPIIFSSQLYYVVGPPAPVYYAHVNLSAGQSSIDQSSANPATPAGWLTYGPYNSMTTANAALAAALAGGAIPPPDPPPPLPAPPLHGFSRPFGYGHNADLLPVDGSLTVAMPVLFGSTTLWLAKGSRVRVTAQVKDVRSAINFSAIAQTAANLAPYANPPTPPPGPDAVQVFLTEAQNFANVSDWFHAFVDTFQVCNLLDAGLIQTGLNLSAVATNAQTIANALGAELSPVQIYLYSSGSDVCFVSLSKIG